MALGCQSLVGLNNQGYPLPFPVPNPSPGARDKRQALKNGGGLGVVSSTLLLQGLWVPTSRSIIPSFTKYVPGKLPQEPHSLTSTLYSGRVVDMETEHASAPPE